MREGKLPVLLAIFAGIVVLFLQLPVIVTLLAAVSDTNYLVVPPQGLTLRWFAQVLADPFWSAALRLSLMLAAAASVLALAIGLGAAYALHHRWVPGAETISTLMMSPMVLPAVVFGVAALQYSSLLDRQSDLLTVLMAHSVVVSPYVLRTSLAALAGSDMALEEAARVLGSSRFDAFRRVTLPTILPGVAAGAVFAFITSFDEVSVSIFLLPPGRTTVPIAIFTAVEQGANPAIAAVSALLILLTGCVLLLVERFAGFHKHV
jgi:putative spermidine/putrescine transport system permease protein